MHAASTSRSPLYATSDCELGGLWRGKEARRHPHTHHGRATKGRVGEAGCRRVRAADDAQQGRHVQGAEGQELAAHGHGRRRGGQGQGWVVVVVLHDGAGCVFRGAVCVCARRLGGVRCKGRGAAAAFGRARALALSRTLVASHSGFY